MGEKAGELAEQELVGSAVGQPAAAAPASSGGGSGPLAEVNVSIDPSGAKAGLKFAYMCLHCGGPREIEAGKYTANCPTCGQSVKSGNDQLAAVATGEHIPTYDRTSTFYP